MDEGEKLQALLDSGLCEYCELISRTSGIDTVFRFRGGVEISHPDRDRAINLAYAYLKEQQEAQTKLDEQINLRFEEKQERDLMLFVIETLKGMGVLAQAAETLKADGKFDEFMALHSFLLDSQALPKTEG